MTRDSARAALGISSQAGKPARVKFWAAGQKRTTSGVAILDTEVFIYIYMYS